MTEIQFSRHDGVITERLYFLGASLIDHARGRITSEFHLSLDRGNVMNHFDQSSVTKQCSRKPPRTPLAMTAAALIALGAWGLALGPDMRFASAQPAQPTQSPQTVQTPMGAVPLSFADLVQKVSP